MSRGAPETLVNGETKIVGLFGEPVNHSLSPAMHNAAFREVGLNFCYLPFRVSRENLGSAMKAIVSLGLQGVNITAPHKEAARQHLDKLSPEANFLEAVNTVKNIEGRLYGCNTDVDGFVYLLENNFGRNAFSGQKACFLGRVGRPGLYQPQATTTPVPPVASPRLARAVGTAGSFAAKTVKLFGINGQ